MKYLLSAACVAALLTTATTARADDEAIGADARCIAVFAAMVQMPAYKDAAGAGLLYYLGRLDARDPKLDLAAAVKHEAARMDRTEYMAVAQRCGSTLKQRNDALKAAARDFPPPEH
ncbi:MAG: hypothetical protein E7812_13570 [Phenylobacterium sp.]|nr:MAG: hypothetical protein E7812_13570 [Phenylobacterium sp.]